MSEQLIDHPALESPSRRDMLKVGLGTGGALLVVFGIPSIAKRFQQDTHTASIVTQAKVETAPFAPNAFIRIDRQGAVTLVMPMVEMGQGTYTSLAMLLAEELEVGLDQVKLEHAPPNDALYANAILHRQLTGMSSSIRAFWTPLRQAGAVARTLLIAAAAEQWGVDPAVCRAKQGVVSAGSRQLSYGQLGDAAAALPVPTPDSLVLKDPKDFTLIGTPAKRLDTPDKVNGHAEFGIDTKQPGMKVAAIAISPVFGGKPKPAGASLCRQATAAASRSSSPLAVTSRRWPRSRSRPTVRSRSIVSSAPSIAAWSSIRTRSRPRCRAERSSA
jgi:isoquinoline 1-oxidoreductase subunit beta